MCRTRNKWIKIHPQNLSRHQSETNIAHFFNEAIQLQIFSSDLQMNVTRGNLNRSTVENASLHWTFRAKLSTWTEIPVVEQHILSDDERVYACWECYVFVLHTMSEPHITEQIVCSLKCDTFTFSMVLKVYKTYTNTRRLSICIVELWKSCLPSEELTKTHFHIHTHKQTHVYAQQHWHTHKNAHTAAYTPAWVKCTVCVSVFTAANLFHACDSITANVQAELRSPQPFHLI